MSFVIFSLFLLPLLFIHAQVRLSKCDLQLIFYWMIKLIQFLKLVFCSNGIVAFGVSLCVPLYCRTPNICLCNINYFRLHPDEKWNGMKHFHNSKTFPAIMFALLQWKKSKCFYLCKLVFALVCRFHVFLLPLYMLKIMSCSKTWLNMLTIQAHVGCCLCYLLEGDVQTCCRRTSILSNSRRSTAPCLLVTNGIISVFLKCNLKFTALPCL